MKFWVVSEKYSTKKSISFFLLSSNYKVPQKANPIQEDQHNEWEPSLLVHPCVLPFSTPTFSEELKSEITILCPLQKIANYKV